MVSPVSDDADLALTAIAGLATAVVLTIAAIALFFIAAAKFTYRVGKLAGQYYSSGQDHSIHRACDPHLHPSTVD